MCFLIKRFLMMTKKSYFYNIYFWCQVEILLLKTLKLLKIPGFILISQIPVFPGFSFA